VFAVAATLLVFSIPMPDSRTALGAALLAEWPSYAAYVISFLTILVIWLNHHAVLDSIRIFDRPLLLLNGILLMTIAVIPFPTGLLARYLMAGHYQTTAAFAYGLTMSGMAVAFTLINTYAKARHLFRTPFSLLGFSTGQLSYPVGTVIALFNYQVALVIFAATAIFYMVLPLLRERFLRDSST
jgi:uncharacterized membrane protein